MGLYKENTKLLSTPLFMIAMALITLSCSGLRVERKSIKNHFKSGAFKNQMTGLVVIDPQKKDTLVNINADQYFIPASNTKIFTLYTALEILPEKIPLIRYQEIDQDSILISGMGDPTSLHPFFKDSTLIHFLSEYTHIGIIENKLQDQTFGPGWAWEDYDSYYAPERAALPLYGNVLKVIKNDSISSVAPKRFEAYIKNEDQSFYRSAHKNLFYIPRTNTINIEIPFKTSDSTSAQLLKSSLKKDLFLSHSFTKNTQILYGIDRDTVLERMMKVSDNFIAEQLLLNAASYQLDSMNTAAIQKFILNGSLNDLSQKPRWVDGSGLSRYNLFTPLSMTHVLYKLYLKFPMETIKHYFPVGGVDGTLKNDFKGVQKPYVYAKTGSLGNTYCLSGYLITAKNKVLIFSYMNNHFMKPSHEIKKEMQKVLEAIRDQF